MSVICDAPLLFKQASPDLGRCDANSHGKSAVDHLADPCDASALERVG